MIQAQRLPVGLLLAPVTAVAGEPVQEFVMSPILGGLIAVFPAVAPTQTGGVEERKPQRAVVGLVGSILAIGKQSHAIGAALVGEIEPLVRRDLILARIVVPALDGSDVPVVGCERIGSGEREGGFQRRFL